MNTNEGNVSTTGRFTVSCSSLPPSGRVNYFSLPSWPSYPSLSNAEDAVKDVFLRLGLGLGFSGCQKISLKLDCVVKKFCIEITPRSGFFPEENRYHNKQRTFHKCNSLEKNFLK